MVGTESASVRAGNWMYLFFNRNDTAHIDYWKVAETSRDPVGYQIDIGGKTDLSSGGAITAVYLEGNDEIHVYYIGKPAAGKKKHLLREVCLKGAKKDGAPGPWEDKTQDLNKKDFDIDPESMLCSAVDSKGYPRIFFNSDDALEHVQYAAFKDVPGTTGKDWDETRFTKLSQ
ncbi:hypothetical protein BKA66DRAFT_545063 [Pyrenochaeta sp. MPI-SDFR-AT-0127]|nr:hypothetical protein BKA66DRAFT_545063 [Pyrenochaeta sp. MPI-SDFR-AT-0127]